MSLALSFAGGFLKTYTAEQRAKLQAERDAKKAEKETRNDIGKFIVENADKFGPDADFSSVLAKKNLSYTDLVPLMNTVNTVGNSFGYGALQFQKPTKKWDEDLRPDDQLRAGGTWLRYFNEQVRDPKQLARMQEHFKQNPSDWSAFQTDLFRYGDMYIDGQRARTPEKGLISEYMEPSDAYRELFQFYDELNPLISKGKPTPGAVQQKENSYAALIEHEAKLGFVNNKENAFVFEYMTEDGAKKEGVYEFANQNQIDALGRLATNLGYSGDRQGIQKFINEFSDVGRATDSPLTPSDELEKAYSTLLSAIEMEQQGFGALSQALGGTPQMSANFTTYLQEEFGGDYRSAVQAYATLMTLKEDKQPKIGYNPRRQKLASADDYFERNKINREQVIEQYEASVESVRQLEELNRLIQENPTGLKAAMQKVGFGIFGEGGQIDQFFADQAGQTGGFEDGTTVESLKESAIRFGFLSPESAKSLSEIDALKLSLAAQMARAVDPSGRLSNQDFEIQLQRLGQTGLFTSNVQAGASLGVVIDEFKRRQRRLEVLHEVASKPAEFGKREARILKADATIRRIQAQGYQQERQNRAALPDAGAGQPDGQPSSELTLDPDTGFYTDGNNFFKDQEGKQPASPEEVLKALGMQ